ncbi:MAG: PD40 domain-containing protein [Planctomycetes bacterium]|nr:PD40 domain-containing protein [Planctomycetota bacterium]
MSGPSQLRGVLVLLGLISATVNAQEVSPRLLLAYGSYKERGKYPTVTFYEHDGQSTGKIVAAIPPDNLRSDSHPSLSHDGRWCAFTSEVENLTSRILLWDLTTKQLVDLPLVNDSPNSLQHSTLSGNGRVLALAAWNRPGSSNRWDILRFDIDTRQLQTPALWNTPGNDERMPALSADGGLLAFVSNSGEGRVADIHLWDHKSGDELPLPGLNSPARDVEPSLSADGRWIAFVSDRPGGIGARDIYLFDRQSNQLVPLPGLNSVAHEQMPSISTDGRYIAFVSERRAGQGERDVFIYDRVHSRLLPTPDLNSPREEIDPCLIVLPRP